MATQPKPKPTNNKQKAIDLAAMMNLEESICLQVLNQHEGKVEDAIDYLLNMNVDLTPSTNPPPTQQPHQEPNQTQQEEEEEEEEEDVKNTKHEETQNSTSSSSIEPPSKLLSDPPEQTHEPSPQIPETPEKKDNKLEETFRLIEESTLPLSFPKPPIFTIYVRTNAVTKKVIDDTKRAQALILTLPNITSADIVQVDLSHDFELAGFIKAQCGGKLHLPIITMREKVIGGVEELESAIQKGEITIENEPIPKELTLGVLDRCLEGAETILSVLNALNPLSWFWGGKKEVEESRKVDIFHVIHTNWYWRSLRRDLHFYPTFFTRVHPRHGDVRAHHEYDEVKAVTVIDESHFILEYKGSSAPDYFRAPAQDCKMMIDMILARSKDNQLEIQYKDRQKKVN